MIRSMNVLYAGFKCVDFRDRGYLTGQTKKHEYHALSTAYISFICSFGGPLYLFHRFYEVFVIKDIHSLSDHVFKPFSSYPNRRATVSQRVESV